MATKTSYQKKLADYQKQAKAAEQAEQKRLRELRASQTSQPDYVGQKKTVNEQYAVKLQKLADQQTQSVKDQQEAQTLLTKAYTAKRNNVYDDAVDSGIDRSSIMTNETNKINDEEKDAKQKERTEGTQELKTIDQNIEATKQSQTADLKTIDDKAKAWKEESDKKAVIAAQQEKVIEAQAKSDAADMALSDYQKEQKATQSAAKKASSQSSSKSSSSSSSGSSGSSGTKASDATTTGTKSSETKNSTSGSSAKQTTARPNGISNTSWEATQDVYNVLNRYSLAEASSYLKTNARSLRSRLGDIAYGWLVENLDPASSLYQK